jgi:hypothetical protein
MFRRICHVSDYCEIRTLGLYARTHIRDLLIHELALAARETVEREMVCHVIQDNCSEPAATDVVRRLLELRNCRLDRVSEKH